MPARNRNGGLHRGTLYDTNLPSTSIDKDIFTDQEVLTSIAGDDLVLLLDVSEDPDKIKYMTRTNFVDGLAGSTITVTDNESTDENNLVTFVAGAATATGLQSIEMDGDFHYNPSTGRLTATQLAGTLQTASQTNITAVGTIATGTWEGTAIASGYIAADAITAAKIADDAIGSEHIADDAVVTAAIADDAITSALIADDAVQTAMIADDAITSALIADDAITSALIADDAVVAAAIANNAITLATHTTGDYVQNITGGVGIDSTGATSGENIAHTLSIDLAEVGEVAIANGDYIAFMDATDSNATKKEAIADVATLFAGTGLTASSSVIGVDASQTQITAVGTIATGTWEGTTVAVAQGGTGATTLNNLITLATHTTGDYVQNITAGTGLTSSGATSGENIAHSLSVDASQTQITAVGTIATGTWAATDVAVAHGGTGASTASGGFDALSPMTAEGDILYGGSSGTVTKLARGSDDEVLTLASGVPTWASATVGDITGVDLTGGTNVNISSETNTTGGAYSSTINLDASPTLTSSSANEPVLTITNTHADATAGFLKFVKDPGSGQGADSDILGTITFHGTDASNNAAEELARIESYVIEADHGSEAGGMKFYVAENDATMTAGLQVLGVKDADGEIDVTIGAGAASTTTIAGTLTMGSTAALTNAGLVAVANQSNITGLGTISSGVWEGTDVGVAHGGTGASTLTANGVLIGNGTSAVSAVDMSTKGGLLAGDGSGNPSILAVGSTGGHVLTVDSSEATGMKWAASAEGAITALNSATANELVTVGSTTTELDAEANLTYSSDILTTASSSADLPRIDITNTHAGATAGKIRFNKDTASGDDNDVMGTIEWYGTDAAENTHERLAYIDSYIIDSAHGSEAAGIRFYVAENDATNTLGLQILGQPDDNGEVDVTIGAGAASTTTIAGTLTMGSTAAMTNAGLLSVANQSSITGLGTISSGVWEGTDVGVAHGGTGQSNLNNLITMGTHTTGNYVATVTAGTGLTSTGATSGESIAHGLSVDAAQTGITSIYATDLILGEDSETAIDFGTADEIDFKINDTTELTLDATALYPTSDAGLDLGTASLEFKDAFFDGTVTSDAFAGPLTGDVTGTASGNATAGFAVAMAIAL